MNRTPFFTFLLASALAGTTAAQDSSAHGDQILTMPIMHDVKTAPIHFPVETGTARTVTLANDAPGTSLREQRVQATTGAQRRAPRVPAFDVDEHGTQWVRGATYKASFGADGATYIPFLGSRAPRNYPVTMRMSSVTSGGVAIGFDADAPAVREGTTVAFDRGTVVEQYLIEKDGMEQRFVFDTLPTRGEIVVTLDVHTELTGRAVPEGLRFENELGHASYSRAFALDAAGRKTSVEEHFENGRLRLVVPAEFVATAELPLVIDPLQSTFVVDTDANEDSNADVAFVVTEGALVVYEWAFSALDHDIYSEKFVNQAFAGQALIDISIDDWRGPRVAGNELNERYLCVAAVGAAGSRIIRGRQILADTLALGTVFTINGTESGDKHSPDVGGDPRLTGTTFFCVVWQRDLSATDTDIHARMVSFSGVPQGASVIFLENSAATLDSRPSISKTCGKSPSTDQDWNIVWQHETSSTNDDVQGARIHWNGTITTPTFSVASTTMNERFPTASEPLNDHGVPRQWLAVYTLDSDLRFRAYNDTTVIDTLDLAAGLFTTLSAPDVTTDGRLWMLAYTSRSNTIPNPDTDVRAASLSTAGGSLSFAENSVAVAASGSEVELRPRIASTLASTTQTRAYIAYDRNHATNGLDVLVGVYDSPINAGGFAYCFGTAMSCPCANVGAPTAGCASSVNPNGATLTATGQWFVTGDHATLTASGMPTTATALYFQGTGQIAAGAVFGDGLRCVNGTIVRLGNKTSANGTSSYPSAGDQALHVKGAIPAAGAWRYYQAWYRNSANYCSASTFNLTNGVARLWAP